MARLLYQAACDGYVNPVKVADILGMREEEVTPTSVQAELWFPRSSTEFSKALRRDDLQQAPVRSIAGTLDNKYIILAIIAKQVSMGCEYESLKGLM